MTINNLERLIKQSLIELQSIGSESEGTGKEQKSKLIFPKYCVGNQNHADKKRISEQEARFLFVRELELEKQTGFYYSIETPTKQSYKFSDKTQKEYEPQIVDVSDGGQSARVDVTLYVKEDDNVRRKHLIEFKHGNSDSCKKDFLKLLCDEYAEDKEGIINYYINILERDDLEKRNTIKSVIKKYQDAIEHLKQKDDLKSNSTLKIILFNIKDGYTLLFEDINLADNTSVRPKCGMNIRKLW